MYYSTLFFQSDDTSYYFSIVALCTLAETTCAHLVLCAPCFPKAINGMRQTRAVAKVRAYMALRGDSAYINKPSTSHDSLERARAHKPKDNWYMNTTTAVASTGTYPDGSATALQPLGETRAI